MRMSLGVRLGVVAVGLGWAGVAQAAPASNVITACVAKIDGFTRIVSSPSACVTRFENVVQFNAQGPAGAAGSQGPAGPAGPTGAQGPAGPPGSSNNEPFLAHTLLVTAGGTAAQNGQLLANTLNAAGSVASVANPYVVELDAGTFDLTGIYPTIQPGISLEGQGMGSTFVTSDANTLYFADSTGKPGPYSFGVSAMTVTGEEAISTQNVGTAVLEGLHVIGRIDFYATSNTASVLLSHSIVNGPVAFDNNSHSATQRFRIVGTQVDSIAAPTVAGTQGCFASYNANLVAYSATCQ